jgi:glyoxylase-like metal-dependent hydrolase (beta-lactamase superfamily II)
VRCAPGATLAALIDVATIHLLQVGSIRDEHVTGTITLILDGEARLIVDPGMVPDRDSFLERLRGHGLQPDEVTHVLLTHHHPDHTINVALFPNADVVDAWAIYRDDLWLDHQGEGYQPSPHVRLLSTPGHTGQDVTWLVETGDGIVACTHAWWLADRTPEIDPYATDQAALEESRRRILELATVVIPGHDRPFQLDGGADAA